MLEQKDNPKLSLEEIEHYSKLFNNSLNTRPEMELSYHLQTLIIAKKFMEETLNDTSIN